MLCPLATWEFFGFTTLISREARGRYRYMVYSAAEIAGRLQPHSHRATEEITRRRYLADDTETDGYVLSDVELL